MEKQEVEQYIERMRNWFINNSKHPRWWEVDFASDVALSALQLNNEDEFIKLVIDYLT